MAMYFGQKKKYGENKKSPNSLISLVFEKEVVSEVRDKVFSEVYVPVIFKRFLLFSWQS